MKHYFYAWVEREMAWCIFRTEPDTDRAVLVCFTDIENDAEYMASVFNEDERERSKGT